LKTEYVKIIDNDPTKKARILTRKISESEYEIIEMYVPMESNFKGIEEELLKEVTDDADRERITLHVDVNRILSKKDR
jgi:predicted GNAT family acetyltransferase